MAEVTVICGLGKAKDLRGQPFGRLIAKEIIGRNKHGNAIWLCECKCGKTIDVAGCNLKSGATQSCGCLASETASKQMTIHGKWRTPEFKIWDGIKERCRRKPGYCDRGITVCERWLASFSNFLEDMGLRPSPEMTIDRIDNDGNYCKENCRWATQKEQSRNRRNTRFVLFRGERRKLAEVCEELGISYVIVKNRLDNRCRRGEELTESMIESARRRQAAVDRVGGTA